MRRFRSLPQSQVAVEAELVERPQKHWQVECLSFDVAFMINI